MQSPILLFADVAIFPGGGSGFVCAIFVSGIALCVALAFGVLYFLRWRARR
jgi:hypothetical protein